MTDFARTLQGGLQVLLVFGVPLLVYFKRWNVRPGRAVAYVLAVYAIWFISYSPTHEGAHLLGGLVVGLDVESWQLLPRFWRGDFVRGYIRWQSGPPVEAVRVSTMAAYLFDALLLGVWAVARRWADRGPFVGATILALTALRCVFDVSNNYVADVMLGGRGDVEFLLRTAPPLAIHAAAWALMMGGVWCAVHQITNAAPRARPA